MIRWGLALFALGMLWPLQPAWAFWTGTALACLGGMLVGRGLADRHARRRGHR